MATSNTKYEFVPEDTVTTPDGRTPIRRHHWNARRYPTAEGLEVSGPAPAFAVDGLLLKGNECIEELAAYMVGLEYAGVVSPPTQYAGVRHV